MSNLQSRFIINKLTLDEIINESRDIASKILPAWDFDDQNDIGRLLLDFSAALSERNNVFSNDLALEARSIKDARDPSNVSVQAANLQYRVRTAQPPLSYIKIELKSLPLVSQVINPYTVKLSNKNNSSAKKFFENINYSPAGPFTISNNPIDYSSTYDSNDDGVNDSTVVATSVVSTPGLYQYTDSNGVHYFVIMLFVEGESKTYSTTHDGLDFTPITIPDTNLIIDEVPGSLEDYGVHLTILGNSYKIVSTFIFGNPADRHYTINPNLDNTWYIQLADNMLGVKPIANTILNFSYRVGGTSAIIPAGDITEKVTIPVSISSIVGSLYNQLPSFNGADKESIAYTRNKAPVVGPRYKQLDTIEKITAVASNIAGVARVRVINIGTTFYIIPIPIGGGFPSTLLRNTIHDIIFARMPAGYALQVNTPSYIGLLINVSIQAIAPYVNSVLQSNAISAINKRIDPLTVDADGLYTSNFAGNFNVSDLGYTLKSLEGSYDYQINQLQKPSVPPVVGDISLGLTEIILPTLSTINVTVTGGL